MDKKNKKCIKCGEPLDNCPDHELVIVGDLQKLAHQKCTNPFDKDIYGL